jgi:general secretion pathway protein D
MGAAAQSAVTNTPAEPLLPERSVDFRGAPIDSVLQTYAQYVGRTLLRSPAVNAQTTITLVQQNPLTRTELIHALDAILAMNNIAMIPIGDKFIKVVPIADAAGAGMKINDMNASLLPEFGPLDTHIVQLKYTKPSEMVPVLQQFTKTPGAVLPIEGSGMLVLRDTAENVRRMLEMIERLDTSIPAEIDSEVIPIKYALATDIANALNSLSGGGGGTTSFGGSGARGSLGTSRTTGPTGARAAAGYPGAGGAVNQQGGFGGGGGLGQPAAAPGSAGGAASPSFTERVRNLVARASAGTGKEEFQILGQTKIIADERMNALLVFASHDDMIMVKKIVKQLDVVLAQVLIEAIIMEVSLDDSRTLGVSSAQQGTFGPSSAGYGGFNNGQPFGFPLLGSGGTGSNGFPGALQSSLPANNGLTYWGQFGPNVTMSVQAAASHGLVKVLSTPRIQTSHGVEADLFVGQTVPYITGTTFGDFAGVSSRSAYEEKQIGITLKVKPLINPDGLVVMDIYQDIGQRGADVTIDGNPVPIVNQRQASATVAVKDRDTIILGGMISTTKTKTKSGVPYLKDIPLLGNLFRSNSDTEQRVELIVLLKPTVLPTPEAAAMVAQRERERLPGVRHAEAEIRSEEAERLKQTVKDFPPTNNVPGQP